MRVQTFCCFFPNYDNRFLSIDIDVSAKYKQDIGFHHEIYSPMAILTRKCEVFYPSFSILTKIIIKDVPWQHLSNFLTAVLEKFAVTFNDICLYELGK